MYLDSDDDTGNGKKPVGSSEARVNYPGTAQESEEEAILAEAYRRKMAVGGGGGGGGGRGDVPQGSLQERKAENEKDKDGARRRHHSHGDAGENGGTEEGDKKKKKHRSHRSSQQLHYLDAGDDEKDEGEEGLNGAAASPPSSPSPPQQQQQMLQPGGPPSDDKKTNNPRGKSNSTSTPASEPGLTMAVLQQAFGPGRNSRVGADGERLDLAGPSANYGPIIMPTRKEGSDAMSVYSSAQSVLPQDPREMLYYCPRRHLLQCYCIRRKASLFQDTAFYLFREHTDTFVMGSRARTSRSSTAMLVHSINQEKLDKSSDSYTGKIVSNFSGTEFTIYSEGTKATRKEIGAIVFLNKAGFKKEPVRMNVILPAISEQTGWMVPLEGGDMSVLRSSQGARVASDVSSRYFDEDEDIATTMTGATVPSDPITEREFGTPTPKKRPKRNPDAAESLLLKEFKENPKSSRILVLQNMPPTWNTQLRGYQLDFRGRAKEASNKNFILVDANQPEKIVLLFGKSKDNRYALDYRYPLCALQAASVAMSVFNSKLL